MLLSQSSSISLHAHHQAISTTPGFYNWKAPVVTIARQPPELSLQRIPIAKACRRHAKCVAQSVDQSAPEAVQSSDKKAFSSSSSLHRFGFSETASAKLVAVVGDGSRSPLSQTSWEDVMQHMARKLQWTDEGFEMLVLNDKHLKSEEEPEAVIEQALAKADILVIVNVKGKLPTKRLLRSYASVPCVLPFESSVELDVKLGGAKFAPFFACDPLLQIGAILPGSTAREQLNTVEMIEEAWRRSHSDDIKFVLLYVINAFVTPVASLKGLRATGIDSLECMAKNCGPEIWACLLDPDCRKALVCLNKCGSADQVCSYRCIASYESPQFAAFSLCALQKHNCLKLSAEIPPKPDVKPLTSFRGRSLTHDLAEDIFIGWLGESPWSWRVAAGQNPAYDQFPCQFQIFYRGRTGKGSVWYDPVFRVKTIEGGLVWRRKHYRVRRAAIPGTFFFSVLDNGVVSKEFWRIVDAADDLSWALFYYSGAAEVVGQSYTGAIIVTRDGNWPASSEAERVNLALENCGIKTWEMFTVNNQICENPPLDIPDGSKLHSLSWASTA